MGMGLKDIALLVGGLAIVFGVVLLGIGSNFRRRRWLTRLGWLTLILAFLTLGYGSLNRNPRQDGSAAIGAMISANAA